MDSYIISLAEPIALQKTLIEKGLRPHWVQAIRGSELTSQQIHDATSWPYSYVAPATPTAIGMSHIKAWKTFLDSSAEYAVFLEEDAVLSPDVRPRLQTALESVPQDYDILYLGCFGCTTEHNLWTWSLYYISLFRVFKQINPFIVSPSIALALHGYVLSRKGARQLIDRLEHRLFGHVDGCILLLSTFGPLKLYAMTKHIVSQTSTMQQFVPSSNATNQHPSLITKLLSNVHFDSQTRLHYICTCSLFQIGSAILTIMTGLIFLAGILLALYGVPLSWITGLFLLLSIPDLFSPSWSILLHYIVLILPTIAFLQSLIDVNR
jgi:GR25 family glycosyltransferase involved in LPS biosynthesis